MALLMMTTGAVSADRSPPPHADCIDARAVTQARHVDDSTLLMKAAGTGYRVDLGDTCPPTEGGDLVALAADGWVCGGDNEYVRVDERLCAVGQVTPLSERDWALALRDHEQTVSGTTLATVVVEAKVPPKRRFTASTEYCVHPRRVRGWQVSGRDIVLSTSPRRGSNEASSYRLELGRTCPESAFGTELQLVSGVGIGWICGHPGDKALIARSDNLASDSIDPVNVQEALLQPSTLSTVFAKDGCPIVAVYPEY